MGVLDELKKEAEATQARRSSEENVRNAMQREIFERLQPELKKFHTYFSEFQRHLAVVDATTLASYTLRDVGELKDLRQSEYKISLDKTKEFDRFQFTFLCHRTGTLEATLRDPAAVADFKELIKKNGLKAKFRDAGRGATFFTVDARVPVLIDFRIDTEREAIILTTRNLPQMGVTRYTLTEDRISGQLLDELAKMVLRRDNDFDHLMGNRMTDTGIFRIRKHLDTVTNPEVPMVPSQAGAPEAAASEKKPASRGRKLFGFGKR